MLAQARETVRSSKGGDRATPLELRPLATGGADDSDEDEADWGVAVTQQQHWVPDRRGVGAAKSTAVARVAGAAVLLVLFAYIFTPAAETSDDSTASSSSSSSSETVEYSFSFDRLRPIWHVMPVKGWQNDPCALESIFSPFSAYFRAIFRLKNRTSRSRNGPVFYGGYYHLFYQHNSYEESSIWGNMSWGHAYAHSRQFWRHQLRCDSRSSQFHMF